MTIEEVADREAIRQLMARYNTSGDRARIDELVATFASDGVLEFSGEASRGRDAIKARLTTSRAPRHPKHTVTRHHLTTSYVEVDGGAASARTYFHVLTDIGLDHHGHYVDRLVKIDGAWLFVHRSVRIDGQSPESLSPPLHVGGRAPAMT